MSIAIDADKTAGGRLNSPAGITVDSPWRENGTATRGPLLPKADIEKWWPIITTASIKAE